MAAHPLLSAGATAGRIDAEAAARWAGAVYQAVRESRGRVLAPATAPGPGRNYYQIRIKLNDGTAMRLLANLATNLVAAADDGDPLALLTAFRDVPRPDVFVLYGFLVAAPNDLEQAVTDDHLADLTGSERHDAAHHGVRRVGDVIFNWFD